MIAPLDPATRERLSGCRVVASVSGGKDSAAMSLWLTENGIEHDRVFMDTGWEHPETYDYLRGPLTAKLGPVLELRSPFTMETLVADRGSFPRRRARFCTQELKKFPLFAHINARVASGEQLVNAVGIRKEESAARASFPEWEETEGLDAEVWRPILAWTLDDVIAIHKKHGLAPNPLYLRGATRVGCWPCIFAPKEEIRLVAELTPERIDRIRAMEVIVAKARAERVAARGEPEEEQGPSFFGLWEPEAKTRVSASIDRVVAWSRTAHGGKNLALFAPGPPDEGCMRWGLCDVASGGAS